MGRIAQCLAPRSILAASIHKDSTPAAGCQQLQQASSRQHKRAQQARVQHSAAHLQRLILLQRHAEQLLSTLRAGARVSIHLHGRRRNTRLAIRGIPHNLSVEVDAGRRVVHAASCSRAVQGAEAGTARQAGRARAIALHIELRQKDAGGAPRHAGRSHTTNNERARQQQHTSAPGWPTRRCGRHGAQRRWPPRGGPPGRCCRAGSGTSQRTHPCDEQQQQGEQDRPRAGPREGTGGAAAAPPPPPPGGRFGPASLRTCVPPAYAHALGAASGCWYAAPGRPQAAQGAGRLGGLAAPPVWAPPGRPVAAAPAAWCPYSAARCCSAASACWPLAASAGHALAGRGCN